MTPQNFDPFFQTASNKLFVGQVDPRGGDIDPTRSGMMRVVIPEVGVKQVRYSTPYHGGGTGGGFFAIPLPGTTVLVCNPQNAGDEWYYLGSIIAPGPAFLGNVPQDKVKDSKVDKGKLGQGLLSGEFANMPILPEEKIYKTRLRPMQYVFKSPAGHKLVISDQYQDDFWNQSIKLESSKGKLAILDDSPQIDCVTIRNEHMDGIRISSSFQEPDQPARAIDIECEGPQSHTTRAGQMNILVREKGKNLYISNLADGDNNEQISASAPPDVASWGKINIKTINNDINLVAKEGTLTAMENKPSIFLTTKGSESVIQLKSDGGINIIGDKGVVITANKNDVQINSLDGDIVLNSSNNILLNTPNHGHTYAHHPGPHG